MSYPRTALTRSGIVRRPDARHAPRSAAAAAAAAASTGASAGASTGESAGAAAKPGSAGAPRVMTVVPLANGAIDFGLPPVAGAAAAPSGVRARGARARANDGSGSIDRVLSLNELLELCSVPDVSMVRKLLLEDEDVSLLDVPDWAEFTSLREVLAGGNRLPLSTFAAAPALDTLRMPCCGIHDAVLGRFNYVALRELDLSHNFLTPDSVAAVGRLAALRVLDLSYNGMTSFPSASGIFAKLETLRLAGNALNDRGAWDALGNLDCLELLDLSENGIVEVPSAVAQYRGFRVLGTLLLCRNLLASEGAVISLLDMPCLVKLDLRDNPLLRRSQDVRNVQERFVNMRNIAVIVGSRGLNKPASQFRSLEQITGQPIVPRGLHTTGAAAAAAAAAAADAPRALSRSSQRSSSLQLPNVFPRFTKADNEEKDDVDVAVIEPVEMSAMNTPAVAAASFFLTQGPLFDDSTGPLPFDRDLSPPRPRAASVNANAPAGQHQSAAAAAAAARRSASPPARKRQVVPKAVVLRRQELRADPRAALHALRYALKHPIVFHDPRFDHLSYNRETKAYLVRRDESQRQRAELAERSQRAVEARRALEHPDLAPAVDDKREIEDLLATLDERLITVEERLRDLQPRARKAMTAMALLGVEK